MRFRPSLSRTGQLAVCAGLLAFSLPLLAERTPFAAKEARVPAAVVNGTAKLVGPADRTQKYELAVAIPVRDQAGLTKLLGDLYNPNSPEFHQYLSVSQFADRFGASSVDYAKVVSYLRAQGFVVTVQHGNRLAVSFTGNADTIERAFNVKLNTYQHPKENRTFYAPDREPTFDGLGVRLQLIAGLDNYVLPKAHHLRLTDKLGVKAEPKAHPNTNYPNTSCYGTPYSVNVGTGACNTYTPSDLRTAYGTTTLTGSGQQIGILGFGGACQYDVALQATDMNVSPTPTVTYLLGTAQSSRKCTSTSSSASDGEQVLDIVMAAGMAPSATLNFFSNTSNDLTIINAMASSKVCSVYTSSWGWTSKNYTAEDVDYQEMAAQGQTYLNATGDDGGYNTSTWDYPSGDPYIIQVGGTQLVTTTNGGSFSNELAWPDTGSGVAPATDTSGGYNYGVTYAQPSWQSGVANTSNGVSSTYRTDPDIVAQADFEYIGCEAGTCQDTYGGTSYATPLWAGILTGLNTISVAATNGTLGFIDPQLYAAGKSSSFSNIFHDITACGGVDSGEETGPNCTSSASGTPSQGYNPVAGYDGATGWGSPYGANLIGTLTVPAFAVSSASISYGSSVSATLSYPDISGAVKIYAQKGSAAAVQVGTCTLTSSTCSASISGSTLGVGTFTMYGTYTEVETYNGTTRTVLKTSNTKTLTVTGDSTTTVVTASPSSITGTGSTTLTAIVTDSIASSLYPAGTVAFTTGTAATSLGSCTLASGTCHITATGSAIAAAGSGLVTATYTPSNVDWLTSSGTVQVTVNADVTFTSVTHNFGSVIAGTSTSGTSNYGVKLTNSSSNPITFSIGLTGSGFAETNNCPATSSTTTTQTVAAGGYCEIIFTFSPTAAQTYSATWALSGLASGTIYAPSNGGTLSGTGVAAGAVTMTTAKHNYGLQAVGTTSSVFGTVITNSTASAVTLAVAAPTGNTSSFTTTLNNCGTTLAAGGSCNLQYEFNPQTSGSLSEFIGVQANGANVTIQGSTAYTGLTLVGTGAFSAVTPAR